MKTVFMFFLLENDLKIYLLWSKYAIIIYFVSSKIYFEKQLVFCIILMLGSWNLYIIFTNSINIDSL